MCSKERAEARGTDRHRWTQKNPTRNFWLSFHMKFCSDLTNQTNLTRSCIKSVSACCLVFLCVTCDLTIIITDIIQQHSLFLGCCPLSLSRRKMNISSLKPLRLPWKTRRTPGLVPRSPPPRLKPRKRSSWSLSCVGPPLCSVWFSSVFSILLPVFSWLSCWVNFFSNFHFQDSCWAFLVANSTSTRGWHPS